jgi:hypothetical protein
VLNFANALPRSGSSFTRPTNDLPRKFIPIGVSEAHLLFVPNTTSERWREYI